MKEPPHTDMSTPTTFEAHGHTWTKHTPGNPMPVTGETIIVPIYRGDDDPNPYDDPTVTDKPGPEVGEPSAAKDLNWEAHSRALIEFDIIGWRYATPPQEKDELTRLREENASMRTAIKAGHTALEKALLVHKTITTYSKQSAEDLAANMEHCGILAEALATLSPFTESK